MCVCVLTAPPPPTGTPTVILTLDSGSYGEASLNELLDDSGSGSGLPLLVQRSIAGQVGVVRECGLVEYSRDVPTLVGGGGGGWY